MGCLWVLPVESDGMSLLASLRMRGSTCLVRPLRFSHTASSSETLLVLENWEAFSSFFLSEIEGTQSMLDLEYWNEMKAMWASEQPLVLETGFIPADLSFS